MKWLSYRVFRLLGWRFEGEVPDIPKMVIIGAPHTSNWDFFLYLAALHHYRIRTHFLAKHSLFRWPFGIWFRVMGGIPVDRARAGGIVRQVREQFHARARMILVIAPEGTRGKAEMWKSGFLKIAEASDVPVVLASVDYPIKTLTMGPAIDVGRDRMAVMDELRAFYAGKKGRHASQQGPVRVAQERS